MKKTHCKYKLYLLYMQDPKVAFYYKFVIFTFKIDTVCAFTLLLYQEYSH